MVAPDVMAGKESALRGAGAVSAEVAELDRCARDAKTARTRRRKAMLRAQEAGATYDEIAGACGVSKATVKAELSRAKGKRWMLPYDSMAAE